MANDSDREFSNLEAGFAELKIERRRISVDVLEPWRHASQSDLAAKDLDLGYEHMSAESLPRNSISSRQGILPALQYSSHLANAKNFADETKMDVFDQTGNGTAFSTLDDAALEEVLDTVNAMDAYADGCGSTSSTAKSSSPSPEGLKRNNSRPQTAEATPAASDANTHNGRLLVFFVPLKGKKDSSFGWQACIRRSSIQKLFDTLGANPEFLLNLLGRPDYWFPRTCWQYNDKDELVMCDYFCQHPRWNTQVQGAPLSVYVLRHMKTRLTAYIIFHKVGDTSVHALRRILGAGVKELGLDSRPCLSLTNPFDIAVLLSTLSLEASKYHVARIRRYMWEQVNKVDDHLAGLEASDRGRLTELTKSLQIISQQADSHLLNANVAILTARGTRDAQARLHDHLSTPTVVWQAAEDAIAYITDSMEKQKMLFLNCKSCKDGTMSLVYSLVIATTIPLTLLVTGAWSMYRRKSESESKGLSDFVKQT